MDYKPLAGNCAGDYTFCDERIRPTIHVSCSGIDPPQQVKASRELLWSMCGGPDAALWRVQIWRKNCKESAGAALEAVHSLICDLPHFSAGRFAGQSFTALNRKSPIRRSENRWRGVLAEAHVM